MYNAIKSSCPSLNEIPRGTTMRVNDLNGEGFYYLPLPRSLNYVWRVFKVSSVIEEPGEEFFRFFKFVFLCL